jgi:Spy/CpxP family protein refolding chaperone
VARRLTDAQVQQIRTLRQAFADAIKADLELIKSVRNEAKAARDAGKTNAEIEAILARASAAMERVRAAEKKLRDDISNVLTPEQRAAMCVVRPHGIRNG